MSIVVNKTRLPVTEWKTEKASVVSVNDTRMRAAKEVVVDINPVQDLHGYDGPWVGGAGKNLFDITKGVFTGGAYGLSVSTSGDTIIVSGTYNRDIANASFRLTTDDSIPRIADTSVKYFADKQGTYIRSIRWTNSTGGLAIDLGSLTNNTEYDIRFKVVIYKTSDGAPASWTPYENICPITGWTGCKTWQRGKNLLDIDESKMISSGYNRYFPFQIGEGTYTICCFGTLGRGYGSKMVLQDADGVEVSNIAPYYAFGRVEGAYYNFTLTKEQSQNVAMFAMLVNGSGITFDDIVSGKLSIEKGSLPSVYEPYSGGNEYQVTFPVLGTNLFDNEIEQGTISTIDGRNYNTTTNTRSINYVPITPGTTYYYQKKTSNYGFYLYFYAADKTLTSFVDGNGYGGTFTAGANEYYLRARFNTGDVALIKEQESMISVGSSRKIYEPYTKTVYDGSFDFVSGDLTIDRKLVFVDGSSIKVEGIYANGTGYTGTIADMYNDSSYAHQREVMVISDKLKGSPFISIGSIPYGIAQNGGARLVFNIPNKSTKEDFNNWLSANKPMALYHLAEPLTFHLTPAQIEMLERNNTIWSDAGDTSVTYAAIRS